jgi:DnaJ homolog subfamily C member 2
LRNANQHSPLLRLSTPDETAGSSTEGSGTASSKASGQPVTSQTQVLALVQALKAFPKEASQRWERVAAAVPGKTVVQCKKKVQSKRVQSKRGNFRGKKVQSSTMSSEVHGESEKIWSSKLH